MTTNTNAIPETLDPLEALATRAEAGARSIGGEVGLKQNVVAEIQHDREDLFGRAQDPQAPPDPNAPIGKRAEHAQARAAAALKRAEARAAVELGRSYCSRATDVLRPVLGRRWNAKWLAAGFTSGSLALPRDPAPQLSLFRAYFRAHAAHENVPMGATAAEADALIRSIEAAHTLESASAAAEVTAKQARDAALAQLRRRLTALRNELALLIGDEDARWYRFGFNRPADMRLPDMVEGLVLQQAGPGTLLVHWQPSTLADTYRVTRQVRGVDNQPVEVGLFADTQAPITGLPSGATVSVRVTARNIAGETLPTEAAVVVT